MNNKVIKNVEVLLKHFGKHVKNDRRLVLLYWQRIDKLNITKENISTQDFLHKATNPTDIVNAKMMLDCIKKGGV